MMESELIVSLMAIIFSVLAMGINLFTVYRIIRG